MCEGSSRKKSKKKKQSFFLVNVNGRIFKIFPQTSSKKMMNVNFKVHATILL